MKSDRQIKREHAQAALMRDAKFYHNLRRLCDAVKLANNWTSKDLADNWYASGRRGRAEYKAWLINQLRKLSTQSAQNADMDLGA